MNGAELSEKYGRLGERLHAFRSEGARLLRLVMSLSPNPSDPGTPNWQSADVSVGDQPVAPEEWQGWLRALPRRAGWLAQLTRLEGPSAGVPSRAQVFIFCVNDLPEAAQLVVSPDTTNGAAVAILEAQAVSAGRAYGAQVGWARVPFERRSPEHLAAWLEARATIDEKVDSFAQRALRILGRRFIELDLPAGAYASAVRKVVRSLTPAEASELELRSDWLTEAEICELLGLVSRKPPQLNAVLGQLAEQAEPHGLRGIASLLGDKNLGDLALFWLACSGEPGVIAARERWAAGAKGAKAKLAAARIARLSALPSRAPGGAIAVRPPSAQAVAVQEPTQVPTRRRDLAEQREPALDIDRLSGLYHAPLHADLLSPEAWADYLQVASLDEYLDSAEDSWRVAQALDLLGHGASRELFELAARRLDPSPPGYAYSNLKPVGWGALFLWAGADLEAYVEAASAALSNARHHGDILPWLEALSSWPPAWADEARARIRNIMSDASIPRGTTSLARELASVLGGDQSAYARLAALGDAAAHPLILMSELLPETECEEQRAARAMLAPGTFGGADQTAAPTNATYAAVLRALASFGKGKVQRGADHDWQWPGRRGLVGGELRGPLVTLCADAPELPSAEALLDLCLECHHRQGDERVQQQGLAMGVRRIAWRTGGSSAALFSSFEACAWAVDGGFAVALWNSDEVEGVEALVGLPFLPQPG